MERLAAQSLVQKRLALLNYRSYPGFDNDPVAQMNISRLEKLLTEQLALHEKFWPLEELP